MKKVKLKDICDIYDGVHITPKYTTNGIPFRSVENLYDEKINKFISNDFYNENYKNKEITKESIYLSRIGTIGKVKYIERKKDEAYYVTLALLTNTKINTLYLSYCLQSTSSQKEILRNSLLNAFPCKINMIDLKNCQINIHKDEHKQKKIGSFLKYILFNNYIMSISI